MVLFRRCQASHHTSWAEKQGRTAKVLQGLLALEVESWVDRVIWESSLWEDTIPDDEDLLRCVQDYLLRPESENLYDILVSHPFPRKGLLGHLLGVVVEAGDEKTAWQVQPKTLNSTTSCREP